MTQTTVRYRVRVGSAPTTGRPLFLGRMSLDAGLTPVAVGFSYSFNAEEAARLAVVHGGESVHACLSDPCDVCGSVSRVLSFPLGGAVRA